MAHFSLIELPTFSDPRGSLTVMENSLPFAPVRTYWISGADGQVRGGHRHHQTRQALIAVAGTVVIYMNDGITEEHIALDHPSRCLLVEPKDWHTMTFGPGSVLLVMSSHPYNRSDYIDDPYDRRVS
ncbi:MAG: FdtA/QdtA family cupin domain-containing protein [Hydrogenophaga sp.]|uniref:sugar 3,4-ketoisomerase n=1 Tax=Hydrogenophaga sp. TaxID=1904254 RepID=UPI001D789831|nr:FdtA/QdtA family cupin domain-containing protein [Hydrogenophaga sp.]MBX3611658.1 FdtA/QdtA family cupin domain-containing protein [Hydrogenophaga sp.]